MTISVSAKIIIIDDLGIKVLGTFVWWFWIYIMKLVHIKYIDKKLNLNWSNIWVPNKKIKFVDHLLAHHQELSIFKNLIQEHSCVVCQSIKLS